ncbi:MAG: hypothetical protein A2W08_08660, partial [Candidatus Rokubacteria bacterium RBG_16_73_20]
MTTPSRRRARARSWVALASLGALAGALAGCAVLTIDVDVYKGPLANDERVQVEQVAVMAIGAKPLLIQLRDRVQAAHDYKDDPEGVQKFRGDSKNKHRFDFMENGDAVFKDDLALKVNAVLSLYKDVGGTRLGPYLAVLAGAGRDYESAYQAFTRTPQKNKQFLVEVSKAFDIGVEDAPTPAAIVKCGPDVTVDALRRALRREYQSFLSPPEEGRRSPGATGLLLAHRCLLLKKATVLAHLGRAWPGLKVSIPDPTVSGKPFSGYAAGKLSPELVSQDVVYALLATEGLAELHSRLLFVPATPPVSPPTPTARERFVRRVGEILEAWPRARGALERQWQAGLDMLLLLAQPRPPAGAREAALLEPLAGLVSELLEPHLLRPLLERDDAPQALAKLRPRLAPRLPSNTAVLKSDERQFVRGELKQALIADPGGIAAALVRANTLARETEFGEADIDAKKIDGRFAPPPARRYGLVRAPHPEIGEALTTGDVARRTSAILEGAAAGFEAGRITEGLETLIRKYREAAHGGAPGDTERQLLDELVGFAQKVLFVANFGLLVEGSPEIQKDSFLLQAVGNAILTQVDDLKVGEAAGDRAARRAVADNAVRLKVWEKLQKRTTGTDQIQCGSPAPPEPGARADAAKGVLDCIVTELRYLHLAALKTGGAGSQEARNAQEALQAALEQRARLIHIRPAAAFLRNSNPVTSLQRDSAATWTNMLSRHALRQFGLGGEDAASRRAVQEFDKQFWQNVNTVRVAGAGRTNYVVTKDDIGNWYVKNFSADPEAIIKAAKSLALYAAGGSLSAGAVERASKKIDGDLKPDEKPPAGPPSGALQRQEKKADDERAALIADLRKVRPALRAAIAAEAAGITDPDQRTLFAIALDLASGDAGCLREGRQRSEALAELADLKACRDEVLGRIDEKPIHAELRRRRAELVRAAEALAAERAQASTAALDARERAERELGVASGQASEGDAEARAAEAKAASASEADKPAALAAAGQARRRADEKAGERDALRARLEAAKRAETAADQEKAAADAALAKARTDASAAPKPLDPDTLTKARAAVSKAFRSSTEPFLARLGQLNRDQQTALR